MLSTSTLGERPSAFIFSLISLLHAVSQIPCSYLCSASPGLSIPLGEARPSGPTDPTGCAFPTFLPVSWESPSRLSRSTLCSACSEPDDTISLGLSHPGFNKKHRQRMNWQEEESWDSSCRHHFLLPTSHHGPDYGTTAVVPFDGCGSGWFQVSDPSCPVRLRGRKTSIAAAPPVLRHPWPTPLWIFPSCNALQLPNQLNFIGAHFTGSAPSVFCGVSA